MKENRLWKLFISMLILNTFTFGGGFIIVALYRKTFVKELEWLKEDEMMDIITIAQSNPGPVSVNASIGIGYRAYGVLGSIVAILGVIIPSFVIISIISVFYNQFKDNQLVRITLQIMRAGIAAIILDVALDLGKSVIKTKNILYIIIMVIGFITKIFFNIKSMYIILFCLGIGLINLFLNYRKDEKQ